MTAEKSLFEKVREAGSHSLIYGLGSALQSLLGFILIPLYTRYYTTEVYGSLALILLCGKLAGAVFYLGASSALARSYFDYTREHDRKLVISTSFWIALMGACVQISIAILGGQFLSRKIFGSSEFSFHILLNLTSSAFAILNTLFFVVLRFQRKSKQVISLNLFALLLTASSTTALLTHFNLGLLAPLLGMLATEFLVFCVLLFLVRDQLLFAVSKKELSIQIPFGVWSIAAGLGYYALDAINRYFVGKHASLSDVGILSLGLQIGSLVYILFVMPFGQIWAPMRMEYRNDRNADAFFGKMLTYYFLIGGIVSVGLTLFSKEMILLIGGKTGYIAAHSVVPFAAFGMLMYGAVNLVDYGLYISRKMNYYAAIFWGTAVLVTLAHVVLASTGVTYSIAAIIFLTYNSLSVIAIAIKSHSLYKYPYENRRLTFTAILLLLTICAGNLVTEMGPIVQIIYKIIAIILLIALAYTKILTKAETSSIDRLCSQIPLLKRFAWT